MSMATQNTGSMVGVGASGVTRAGADKYPNPFFDIASEYVPSDINSIFELTEFLMTTMAPFKAVSERVIKYFLTEIVVEGEEDEEREKYENLFTKQLKAIDKLAEIGLNMQCFHGDTKVITRTGVFRIRELDGQTVEVLSQGGVWRKATFACYGTQELMRVTLADGTEILATPGHEWLVRNCANRLRRVRTDGLTVGHRIERVCATRPELNDDYRTGICHGFVYGDGTVYNKKNKRRFASADFVDAKIEDMLPYFDRYGKRVRDYSCATAYGHTRRKRIHGFPAAWKQLPPNTASASYWYGFVCGLFAADGHVDSYGCPVLVQNNKEAIYSIRDQLPRIGMSPGQVCAADYESTFKRIDGGTYGAAGTSYHLGILKNSCVASDFLRSHHRKAFEAKRTPQSRYGRYVGIRAIERTELVEPVYCCNEPETHSFVIANGIITGNCYGNVFISLYLPFDRMLICPQCGFNYHCETLRYKFEKGEFVCTCKKCGYHGVFDHKDRRSPDIERVRLILWNPKTMKLRTHPISGKTEYFVELDGQFCEKIRTGNPFYLNDTPWTMIETALRPSDRLFRFNPGSIFHLKTASLAGLPIRGWGLPPLLPNFKLAYYIQLLRRYDEAITLDYVCPFRVLFPQAPANSSQDALSLMNMGAFAAHMKQMVENHRKQLTDVQIAPFAIGYQMLGGEAKTLSPKDSIAQAFDELFTAMSYPADLYKGTLTLQAAPVALRLFEKDWCHLVTGYNEILEWIRAMVGRYFRWSDKIEVSLRPVTLADDLERKALLVQSAAGGDVSKQTAYRPMGIDYMEEQKRIVEEQQEIQRLQQKAQQEAATQPMDGSGGEDSLMSTGYSPTDIKSQGEEIAKQIITAPAAQRRNILVQILHSNPTLHAMVMQALDQLRQGAASQGKQMLEAGQL